MHIIGFLIFGLIIGLLARAIYPGRQHMGWLTTAVLGMVGSLLVGLIGLALSGNSFDLKLDCRSISLRAGRAAGICGAGRLFCTGPPGGKMKLMDIRLFSIAAAGIFACSHAQPTPDASAKQEEPKSTQGTQEASRKVSAEEYHAQGQADLDKALEQLKGVSVFFEFDSAQLTKDAQEKLSNVAEILVKHPELKVRIEGNADERGSEQYNLALGQRRADAAKKYLDNLGVKLAQITAISFGAEKPKALGHDEEAWKQNRRDDVKAKPEAQPQK